MAVKKKHRNESFESLVKRFKKNIEKKDIINEVRRREHFVKSSTKRKLSKELAVKKEHKRQEEQDTKRIPV
jgi:small subunit ribosomal protein S21